LDFHSPYGCSKGCGDQYVRDYARIYGLRTVVFRQSCIYGPRQFGIEDQGWLAWFTIAALSGKPITVYGDGKQVRDVLWVEDLIDAYLAAIERADLVKGRIYNVGGGPANALSIWAECGKYLEELMGDKIRVSYADWRPGDQLCCVLDIARAREDLNWSPKMSCREGIKALWSWVKDNLDVIKEELEQPN
jgi:CDP-paratose 2-epimerase